MSSDIGALNTGTDAESFQKASGSKARPKKKTSAPKTRAKRASAKPKTPLVVDLDGTLLKSDILIESAFAMVGRSVLTVVGMFKALLQGKAQLKAFIASTTDINVVDLPYDEQVLSLIDAARAGGRRVYLASASHERYVSEIAEHLGLFDGWFASDEDTNLSGGRKAELLIEKFGKDAFDYIGNDAVDLEVWAEAKHSIAVNTPRKVNEQLKQISPGAEIYQTRPPQLKTWIKLFRVYQWTKNALVFVPLLTAQQFGVVSIFQAVGAFFAFSLAASAIYIVNDLIDLEADRAHPTKKNRPLAAGTLPIAQALIAPPVLLTVAFIIAALVSPAFLLVLFGYLILTTLYTFSLKRKLLFDVIALSGLYTVRVIGGAAAVSVVVSTWLLGFSVFFFTCLALIKRYTELAVRFDADLPDSESRKYKKEDLPIVAVLATAAGFNAVTVFALYVSDMQITAAYANPEVLWLLCPVLMYWLGRAVMLAHRREMHDDPIVFALRDRNSRVIGFAAAIVWLCAIVEIPFF